MSVRDFYRRHRAAIVKCGTVAAILVVCAVFWPVLSVVFNCFSALSFGVISPCVFFLIFLAGILKGVYDEN